VQARRNRAVLGAALTSSGLVNYGTEWWHRSYGDRYWAMLTGARTARYAAVTPLAGQPERTALLDRVELVLADR
jgi:hypothetical protein